MLYLVLIFSLIAMGAIGYLTYKHYKKAEAMDRPKVLAIGGIAMILLSLLLKFINV